MQCGRQTYKNLADIVNNFASDQQYWSVKFLEAWDIMATNGYKKKELNEELSKILIVFNKPKVYLYIQSNIH